MTTGYDKALNKVLQIRKERQKIYGDGWKNMQEYEFVAFIKNKCGRLEHLFLNGNSNYEKIDDTLIDLINYCLFYLEVRGDKK